MLKRVEAHQLPYASSAVAPSLIRRHFHVWLLPLIWLPGGWGATVYYGDEYFAFAMSHVPTGWPLFPFVEILQRHLPGERSFQLFVAVGFIHWVLIGWLLDRLRAWRRVYLLIPVVFLAIVTSRIAVPPHIPHLPYSPGQEWERDAMCVAACWAVFVVGIAVLVGSAAAALVRRIRRQRWGASARSAR